MAVESVVKFHRNQSKTEDLELMLTSEPDSTEESFPHSWGTVNLKRFPGLWAVLKNCVNKLTLLSRMYNSQVIKTKKGQICYKSLKERFDLKNVDNFGERIIGAEYTSLHKLLNEVDTLIELFTEVLQEITILGGATSMDIYLENMEKMKQDEEELLQDVRRKKEILQKLITDKKNCKADHVKKCEDLEKISRVIVGELKDDLEYARGESIFIDKWEKVRREQNTLMLKNNEGNYLNTISNMSSKIESEDLCHDAFTKCLEELIEDHQKGIEQWMEIYDKDMDGKEMEIYVLKNRLDDLTEKKEKLQVKYEIRAQEMEDYLEYKQKQKEIKARIILENRAARIIQAWWRLTMIEKKLGPYKKKKKGKKGKNPKKKPKGKK